MKYFSCKNNTFYAGEFRADYERAGTWPADAVPVDDAVFTEFSAPPPAGMQRVAGPDGLPMWAPVPPLPADQRREVSGHRDLELVPSGARGARCRPIPTPLPR